MAKIRNTEFLVGLTGKHNTKNIEYLGTGAIKISATSDVSTKFTADGLYGGKDLGYILGGSNGAEIKNTYDVILDLKSALYHLDNLNDEYGRNNLTNYNGVTFVPGDTGFGNCANFVTGSSQFLGKITPKNLPSGLNPFTIRGKFYSTDVSQTRVIVDYGNNTGGTTVRINTQNVGGNRLVFSDVTGVRIQSSVLSNSTWYHFELTFDGTTYRLFLNGNLEGSYNATTVNIILSNITIGAAGYGVGLFWDGKIDEIEILSFPLHIASFTPPTSPSQKYGYLDGTTLYANSWYNVFAVDDGLGGFKLRSTPFIRVYNDTGTSIGFGQHSNPASLIDMELFTNAYTGSKLLVLTGSQKGSIRNITANGGANVTYGGGALNLAQGDWVEISPAGATNFRYLGSIFTDGAVIRRFICKDGIYLINLATVLTGGSATAWGALDLSIKVSPLAISVWGVFVSGAAVELQISSVIDGSLYKPFFQSANSYNPFPELLLAVPQTMYYINSGGGGNSEIYISHYKE